MNKRKKSTIPKISRESPPNKPFRLICIRQGKYGNLLVADVITPMFPQPNYETLRFLKIPKTEWEISAFFREEMVSKLPVTILIEPGTTRFTYKVPENQRLTYLLHDTRVRMTVYQNQPQCVCFLSWALMSRSLPLQNEKYVRIKKMFPEYYNIPKEERSPMVTKWLEERKKWRENKKKRMLEQLEPYPVTEGLHRGVLPKGFIKTFSIFKAFDLNPNLRKALSYYAHRPYKGTQVPIIKFTKKGVSCKGESYQTFW